MTHEEAKFRLKACRPNGQDNDDPAIAPALEHVRHDLELQAWLERERTFDRLMMEKLRGVTPPAELRQLILAGAAVTESGGARWHRLWRHPMMLGLAAAFVVVLGVAALLWRPAPSPEDVSTPEEFLRLAQADLNAGGPMSAMGRSSANIEDVRRWLESPENKLTAGMPFGPKELKAGGCRVIPAGKCEVLQICFQRGKLYHVYVAPRARFPQLRLQELPILRQQGGMAMATWADAQYVYVLASPAGLDAVRSLL